MSRPPHLTFSLRSVVLQLVFGALLVTCVIGVSRHSRILEWFPVAGVLVLLTGDPVNFAHKLENDEEPRGLQQQATTPQLSKSISPIPSASTVTPLAVGTPV
jgi:hypothetical protein